MALKNAYKNKLMGVNNRNSLQNNIQNSAQSVLNDSQNIESGLSNETQAQSTTPNYANNTAVNNYGWQDYASLINAKTTNPKAELQTAMQRAQSASNEYLKALGLAGSGMGQSQLSDIGVQYQNALSKINQTAQDEVNAQLNSNFEGAVSKGRYSARDVQNYINQYGEQTGLGESWKNVAEDYGTTYEQEASNVFQNLKDIIEGNTYELADKSTVTINSKQKKYAEKLRDELVLAYNNGNQEEFYKILDENVDFLNTLEHTQAYGLQKNKDGSYEAPEKYSNLPMSIKNFFDATMIKNREPLRNQWYKKNDVYFYEDSDGTITAIKNGKLYSPNFFELKQLVGE